MGRIRSTILLCFLCLAFAGRALSARGAETLRPEQLHAGMKGYGLTVFKGTKPDRFVVEVLGVLKNVFPKQDMILIRMSGADLEKTKVIAGMSGSPIYIDGKLIGALAYGWGFENEPLAGVTPIHNMIAQLNPPAAPSDSQSSSSASGRADLRWLQPPAPSPLLAASDQNDAATPRPLMTPLSLGGFSPRVIDLMSEKLQRFGLLPTAVGGGGFSEMRQPTTQIEPGSGLGVQLIRGDFNAVAVGTATYVEKNKILAFGHPFFQGGRVEAPAVLAEVHTIMSSLARSFKMATAVGEIGSMIGDWQSCIVADTRVKAKMIPASIEVTNRDTGHHERYLLEMIDNEAFSPMLVEIAITEAIFAASSSSQDTTVRVNLMADLPNRTLRVSDTFFNPSGGLVDPDALAPLVSVFNTPFGHTSVKYISVNVDAALTRQTAEIKRAYFSEAEVERGETAALTVVLKPFGQPEVTQAIPIKVPADGSTMRQLAVTVLAGSNAPPDVAPPDNLNDYLDVIEKQHCSTELVALVPMPGQGLQYRGKLLKRLPASVASVLDDASTSGVAAAADIKQIVAPTDWVLSGRATARVSIRQE